MAVKFWVPVATATLRGDPIGVTPLNKQVAPPGEIDETDRVSIVVPQNQWRLRGYPGSVTVSHGGITSVKLHARIYMSNNGPFSWDFSTYDPYVAPYVTTGGVTTYSLPDAISYGVNVGYDFVDYTWNFNIPGQPSSKDITWDVTGLTSWDNTKLAACEYGLSMDEEALPDFDNAGWRPQNGPAGSTPRYNVSQLILEVDAADPAPSYAGSFMAVFA